jgi:hypothetical protein
LQITDAATGFTVGEKERGMEDELWEVIKEAFGNVRVDGSRTPELLVFAAVEGAIKQARAQERARVVKAAVYIIRDACFRGMGNRPEPTWQDVIERIQALDAEPKQAKEARGE